MIEISASAITDPDWLRAQLAISRRRYQLADQRALGVLWWYSASSVLLGPALSGLDPALSAVTLVLQPDGRVLDARSAPFDGDIAARVRGMLSASIDAVAAVSGARVRQLWAITTDSLANRLLWAGQTARAESLAAEIGPELPRPRYVRVGGRQFVRRGSCCLIYQATETPKCLSCPRQTPEERHARLASS
ncbi:MAG: (2Fe-2S)-binding protein [Kibdelosporangium sp.]